MGTREFDKLEVIGDRDGCGMSLTKQVGIGLGRMNVGNCQPDKPFLKRNFAHWTGGVYNLL